MFLYTEVFGFEEKDLDAVTEAVATALETRAELRFGEPRGGGYSAFDPVEGGGMILQHNLVGIEESMDFEGVLEEDWAEEDYKEFGIILLIEQRSSHFDYAPKLATIERFPATLLYRKRYNLETRERELLFELKEARKKVEST